MSRYARGHRPRHGSMKPAHYVGARQLRDDALPSSIDFSKYVPTLDQGPTSSCTGHAHATAIAATAAATGIALPWVPSPDDLYKLGRCIERGGDVDVLLTDSGADQIGRAHV